MGSESQQHKLDRVRRPRVQITYDVETNGAMQKVELPFVVGVMADLSAQRKTPLPAMKDRKFVEIDRDNINKVMADAAPELQMRVDNKLAEDGSQLAVNLKFKNLDDFEPGRVAELQRSLEVALGAHGGKADAIAIDQLAVRARADPRPPQLFERDVEEMEEARVVHDAGMVDVGEANGLVMDEHQGLAGK